MVPNTDLNRWGCSSNGRAPALHAGGTGIDTLLLHTFFVEDIVGRWQPRQYRRWGVSSVVEQLVAAR